MELSNDSFLHLYLGCDVVVASSKSGMNTNQAHIHGPFKLRGVEIVDGITRPLLDGYTVKPSEVVKPVLRPLRDITEEEATQCGWLGLFTLEHFAGKHLYKPTSFPFLLSRCFDLLGLIEAGLAVDYAELNAVV